MIDLNKIDLDWIGWAIALESEQILKLLALIKFFDLKPNHCYLAKIEDCFNYLLAIKLDLT